MENNKKKIITLVSVFTVIFAVIGGTVAYLRWQTASSQETSVTFTVTSEFSCSADGGDISNGNVTLAPTSCDNATYAIKREITLRPVINSDDKTIYMDLWLDIESLDTGLENNKNFKWVLSPSSTDCSEANATSHGTFENVEENGQVMLLDGKSFTKATQNASPYYLYIWLDSAETSPDTYNQNFSFKLNGECTDVEQTPSLTGAAATLVANANPTTLMYADATAVQKGNMWTFNQAETEQVPETIDYRFIGDSPNNWIKFNGDEDWRIIGVFDNKIKIIKSTKIANTNYLFDYKKTGVGSSTSDLGSNDWTDSQLMYMLNTPIYKNSDGTYNTTLLAQELLKEGYTLDGNYIKDNKTTPNIIYELGKVPASIAVEATSYSGSAITWELNEIAISQIEKSTFYLGGPSSEDISASEWYNMERGRVSTIIGSNPTNWTGYVGLMYPSDHAYTYAYGVDDTCFGNTSICNEELGAKSWLYKEVISASSYPWTISPASFSENSVFHVDANFASVITLSVFYPDGVHPSIYLKSGIELSGKGTELEPYEIIE